MAAPPLSQRDVQDLINASLDVHEGHIAAAIAEALRIAGRSGGSGTVVLPGGGGGPGGKGITAEFGTVTAINSDTEAMVKLDTGGAPIPCMTLGTVTVDERVLVLFLPSGTAVIVNSGGGGGSGGDGLDYRTTMKVISYAPPSGVEETATAEGTWPVGLTGGIAVPAWATEALLIAKVGQAFAVGNGQNNTVVSLYFGDTAIETQRVKWGPAGGSGADAIFLGPTPGGGGSNMPAESTTTTLAQWPQDLHHAVTVPSWATEIVVTATISGVFAINDPSNSDTGVSLWVNNTFIDASEIRWSSDLVGGFSAQEIVLTGTLDVTSFQGDSITLKTQAVSDLANAGNPGRLRVQENSRAKLQWTFLGDDGVGTMSKQNIVITQRVDIPALVAGSTQTIRTTALSDDTAPNDGVLRVDTNSKSEIVVLFFGVASGGGGSGGGSGSSKKLVSWGSNGNVIPAFSLTCRVDTDGQVAVLAFTVPDDGLPITGRTIVADLFLEHAGESAGTSLLGGPTTMMPEDGPNPFTFSLPTPVPVVAGDRLRGQILDGGGTYDLTWDLLQ